MRRSALVVCICFVGLLHVVRAQGPQPRPAARTAVATPAAKLPVRRVVLYKNGIGYFEHVGRVRGNQSLTIDFNTAQLNDVLKSLTTIDLGGGRIADVSFNSEAPFAQRLGALALPIGDHTTPMELLGALRGARLDVRAADRLISGRLLSVEQRPRRDEAPRQVLTLVTDAGEMRSIELTPAVTVKLAERDSAEQVSAYLALLASNRSEDRRRMTIAAQGAGARDILVSYVSEVPVWKTNYRLVMPQGGGKPVLQGWAIVDNTIGEDWDDVELSMVAGAPQSFIQALSQPQYARRPVVGVSSVNQQTPQTHQSTLTERVFGFGLAGRVLDQSGAVLPGVTVAAVDRMGRRSSTVSDSEGRYVFPTLAPGSYRLEFALMGFKSTTLDRAEYDGTGRPVQDVKLQVGALTETVTVAGVSPRIDVSSTSVRSRVGGVSGFAGDSAGGSVGSPAAAPLPFNRAEVGERLADMQAAAQGLDLGDLFEYRVAGTVTIRKNQSALVPILRAEVGVERVSLWNERVGGARPLRSVWLTNSSGLTLDAGTFTVLEDATFAGEGLLDPIKPGEKRLLSYAVDLGVQVESRRGDDRQRLSRVQIARGVAVQHTEQMERKVYTVRNSDTFARTIIVEHPVRPGWTLAKGVAPVETSIEAYRFVVPVEAKSTATLVVEERRPIDTNYSISQLSDEQIAVFVRQTRENTRLTQALRPILAKKADVASLRDDIDARQAEANKIAEDQGRLRENMAALKGSAGEQHLLKRYVGQLDQQESRIAVLRQETADLEKRLARAESELAGLIEALALDLEVDADVAAASESEAPDRP
jgi:hypothetical protein